MQSKLPLGLTFNDGSESDLNFAINCNTSAKNVKIRTFITIFVALVVLLLVNVEFGFFVFGALFLLFCLLRVSVFTLGACFFKNKIFVSKAEIEAFINNNDSVKIYTILVPIFKENKDTINNLSVALQKLQYPKEKLDIKLILEEFDTETRSIISNIIFPDYFSIIVVPHSNPQTKPKACNYAALLAKGEYITIYDAEDIPEPDQIAKAACIFAKYQNIACLQAELGFYNKNENILTKLFSMEYLLWFRHFIKYIDWLGYFITLGGTSNHIRTEVLKNMNYWDSYNVTEDADLGVRLGVGGYRVCVFDSVTLEECPSKMSEWLMQRSRWIKGFMITYFTHIVSVFKSKKMSSHEKIFYHLFFAFSGFGFIIGFLYFYCLGMIGHDIAGRRYFDMISFFPLISFFIICLYALMLDKLNYGGYVPYWEKVLLCFIIPFYFLLHFVASLIALFQIFTNPYKWNKTNHYGNKTKFLDKQSFSNQLT